jgi:hypothetical protein
MFLCDLFTYCTSGQRLPIFLENYKAIRSDIIKHLTTIRISYLFSADSFTNLYQLEIHPMGWCRHVAQRALACILLEPFFGLIEVEKRQFHNHRPQEITLHEADLFIHRGGESDDLFQSSILKGSSLPH